MKRTVIFSLLMLAQMLCGLCVSAQSDTVKVSIGGEVVDKERKGEAVVWATVRLLSATDSTKIYGTATDADGFFKLDGIDKGRYNIEFSCVGYEKRTIDNITLSTDTVLPVLALKASAKMLDEVTVNATYTKIDKDGNYHVQVKGNPLAKTNSTENFLRTVRGLSVTDGLLVLGKSNYVILLDDRVISYEQLKNIPTSMIERIELKQQAPTEYASSGGMVPLMRVVLRKEPGLLGVVGLNSNYGASKSFGGDEYAAFLLSLDKFSMIYNISNTNRQTRSIREQNVFYSDHTTHLEAESKSKMKLALSNDLNMRYSFTNYDHVDLNASYSTNKSDNSLVNTGAETGFNQYDDNSRDGKGIGVRIQKSIKKDGQSNLVVKGSYSESGVTDDRKYDILSGGMQKMNLKNRVFDADASALATYLLGETQSVSAGVIYGRTANVNRYAGIDGNTVRYMNDMNGKLVTAQTHGWLEYRNFIAKKVNLTAEVNFDHYKVTYDDRIDPNMNTSNIDNGVYGNLSFYIPFNAQKQHYLNVSARYSYSYPNYGYYMPTVVYQSDKVYSKGNNDLDVEKLFSLDLAYSLNRHFSVSYYYEFRRNLVSVFMHQDANDPTMYYTTPENSGHYNDHELSLNYQVNPVKIWTINSTLRGTYMNTVTPDKKTESASANFYMHNNVRLTNNVGLNAVLYGTSPTKSVNVKQSWSYSLGLGAYASFLKNRLKMDISFNNALNKRTLLTTSGDGWRMERRDKLSAFSIMYNVQWNFNVGKRVNGRNVESVGTSKMQLPTI